MAEEGSPMRVLEFYSGIGGLRYSLEVSGVKSVLVEAFDINDVANDVYEHNFGHRPSQGNIQGLSVQQLDKYRADAWLMSPPCQPYTRQGLRKDTEDARASSFLQIIQCLPLMDSPPTNVLVENVIGFENSVTHSRLLAVLEDAGFVLQEFILSPLQFGIPYSRPRYFCLAKRVSDSFLQPGYNGQLLCSPGPLLHSMSTQSNSRAVAKSKDSKDSKEALGLHSKGGKVKKLSPDPTQLTRNEPIIDPAVQCGTVGDYLESIPAHAFEEGIDSQSSREAAASPELPSGKDDSLRLGQTKISTGNNIIGDLEQATSSNGLSEEDPWKPYKVPVNVLERWIDASVLSEDVLLFLLSPWGDPRHCNSTVQAVLLLYKKLHSVSLKDGESLEQHIFDLRLEGRSLASLGLRYFTPREVANLHSFPDSFRFPAHIKLKQRYALLGNSLSVAVVSSLLRYLFSTPTSREPFVGQ